MHIPPIPSGGYTQVYLSRLVPTRQYYTRTRAKSARTLVNIFTLIRSCVRVSIAHSSTLRLQPISYKVQLTNRSFFFLQCHMISTRCSQLPVQCNPGVHREVFVYKRKEITSRWCCDIVIQLGTRESNRRFLLLFRFWYLEVSCVLFRIFVRACDQFDI